MNFKDAFTLYIREQSSDGSNRASSYIRAIDLLDSILSRKAAAELDAESIWTISSPEHVQRLYQQVLEQQRLGEAGIFQGETPVSYFFFSTKTAAASPASTCPSSASPATSSAGPTAKTPAWTPATASASPPPTTKPLKTTSSPSTKTTASSFLATSASTTETTMPASCLRSGRGNRFGCRIMLTGGLSRITYSCIEGRLQARVELEACISKRII